MTATATYTKLRSGEWGVRIPLDGADPPAPGDTVTVIRRDGETRRERVGRILWRNTDVALATLSRRGRRECDDCGHTRDECADLDCTCRSCGGMMR